MIEILWHGRGGQGAFTAARLLGAAASLEESLYGLAFPSFGPERRGAPMRAFTKVADRPIGDRSAISSADYVVYLDDTLFSFDPAEEDPAWAQELKPGGRVLVNSTEEFADPRVLSIDANGLSETILGRPIPNTVFLGALAALDDSLTLSAMEEAIRQLMAPKLHEKNCAIVRQAYEEVLEQKRQRDYSEEESRNATAQSSYADNEEQAGEAEGHSQAPAEAQAVTLAGEHAGSGQQATADVSRETLTPGRNPQALIPQLRDTHDTAAPSLDPAVFAQNTCYQAGHLVTRNAGWRNQRPVISADVCTGCLQCYLYCPDGTIYKTGATKDELAQERPGFTAVAIDYDFCKGCGICAKVCRFDAIAMIPEQEAQEAETLAATQQVVGLGVDSADAIMSNEYGEPLSAEEAAAGEKLAAQWLAEFEQASGEAHR